MLLQSKRRGFSCSSDWEEIFLLQNTLTQGMACEAKDEAEALKQLFLKLDLKATKMK